MLTSCYDAYIFLKVLVALKQSGKRKRNYIPSKVSEKPAPFRLQIKVDRNF